ncbi:MAG TPA: PEGA domain-containing protein [Bryobacteraceae bacterium]|nr:PEGA domain-containing protein [Bryobacteraceae bacterium]
MLSCVFRIWAPVAWLVLGAPAAAVRAQILPQATAQILVESSNGAEVYLDEKRIGVVPVAGSLTIPNVSPGPHRVKVSLAGKRDFEQRLVAAAGETNRIRAVLTDRVGNVELYTAPGATVEVDGRKAGTADDTGSILIRALKVGPRKLRIFREGYNERTDEVEIDSGETLTITLDLDAAVRPAAPSGPLPTFVLARTLVGFRANNVSSVAFSPDSKWVMAGSNQGGPYELRIWETRTGREVRALYDDASIVVSILCAPDFTWCASQHTSSSGARTLRLWDPKTGTELHRFADGEPGDSVGLTSISPDGKRLVVSRSFGLDAGETTVFDTSTWRPFFKVPRAGGTLNPDASLLVTTGKSIQFWDALTGKRLPKSLAGSGDGAQFSPDGKWLAVYSNGQVQVWEIDTGRMGVRFGAPEDNIYSAVFSPDGRLLIANRPEVTVWDFASAKPIQKLSQGNAIGVSPDGQWIAVGVDLSVRLWQKQPGPR